MESSTTGGRSLWPTGYTLTALGSRLLLLGGREYAQTDSTLLFTLTAHRRLEPCPPRAAAKTTRARPLLSPSRRESDGDGVARRPCRGPADPAAYGPLRDGYAGRLVFGGLNDKNNLLTT